LLEQKGYEAHPTTLPSVSDGSTKAASLYDDAQHIRTIVSRLADQGKYVVLVANSYGGMPVSQCTEKLDRASHQAMGKLGALIGIVYLSSFAGAVGDCIHGIMEGRMAQQTVDDKGFFTMQDPEAGAAYIFSHLSEDDQRKYTRRLRKQSARTFDDRLTHAGYLDVPSTYFLCTDDLVVPPEVQTNLAMAAIEKGADMLIRKFDSDHCPQVSHPEEVVQVLIEAAARGQAVLNTY
jgi:pimeloyl-ACP methyl ester carboxylesterase